MKCFGLRFHKVASRNFFTCEKRDKKELAVFDIDEEKFLPPAKIQFPHKLHSSINSILFEEEGKLQVALLYQEPNRLQRINWETGEELEQIASLPEIRDLSFKYVHGRPHFVAQGSFYVLLGNFDGSAPRPLSTGNVTLAKGWIEWQGQLYFYSDTDDAQSRVFALDGSVISLQEFSRIPRGSFIFNYDGSIYRFRVPSDDLPSLYRLTVEEEKL